MVLCSILWVLDVPLLAHRRFPAGYARFLFRTQKPRQLVPPGAAQEQVQAVRMALCAGVCVNRRIYCFEPDWSMEPTWVPWNCDTLKAALAFFMAVNLHVLVSAAAQWRQRKLSIRSGIRISSSCLEWTFWEVFLLNITFHNPPLRHMETKP